MAINVVMGATLQCSFGMSPATLIPLPKVPPVLIEGRPAANINDHVPMANIPTFGMCQSIANPTVAAATAAALGVLTPMPCVPATATPWIPLTVTSMVGGAPALTAGSTCNCLWGGLINITNPGATQTMCN